MRTRPRALVAVLTSAIALGAPSGAATAGEMPAPTVAPLTGGKGVPTLIATSFEPSSVGYVLEEFSLAGTATSYAQAKPFGPDGRWEVEAAETAPYTTRLVVYRPEDPKDFDGTAFVEWLNVSAGFDSAPDWGSAHTQMIRAGAAWIGVSAQSVGVQGGQVAVAGQPSGGVKGTDPERYASLSHPGDAFSYDMFTQAGLAARGKTDVKPLDGLKVKRVIALGESQSAFRMVTYVNAIQPVAGVFDGFLVHSRAAGGAGLGASPGRGVDDPSMPDVARIRSDLDVPVLTFQTETDLTRLGYVPARQKDSKRFRLWEVAGTAHADAYTAGVGFSDVGDGSAEKELLDPAQIGGGPLNCSAPINAGPAFAVLDAAVFHLERWVRDGKAPPKAPRIEVTGAPEPTIVRDEHGNAKGGIRTPLVDVPIATLDGEGNEGGSFCGLFGNTKPFDAAKLVSLYGTHDEYSQRFDAAADEAVDAGFWLEPQAENFRRAAAEIELGLPSD